MLSSTCIAHTTHQNFNTGMDIHDGRDCLELNLVFFFFLDANKHQGNLNWAISFLFIKKWEVSNRIMISWLTGPFNMHVLNTFNTKNKQTKESETTHGHIEMRQPGLVPYFQSTGIICKCNIRAQFCSNQPRQRSSSTKLQDKNKQDESMFTSYPIADQQYSSCPTEMTKSTKAVLEQSPFLHINFPIKVPLFFFTVSIL